MKKLFMLMTALLIFITGCSGMSESDYNKELEKSIATIEKLTTDHMQDPSLEGNSKYYHDVSVEYLNVSKLELKGADLTEINKYFEEKSKYYEEFGNVYKEYDKKFDGAGFEAMTEEQILELSTAISESVQKYTENITKYKEAADKSLEKQYKDKDISKESYELIKKMMEITA